MTEKQRIGKRGEDEAARYLEKKGLTVLERNYRSRRNETDIIAEDGEYLVFVEVKTTSSDIAEEFKLPSEAVDEKKKECLFACATDYLKEKRCSYRFYRFDVIEVYLNRETPEINHIENAFYKKERTRRQWKR